MNVPPYERNVNTVFQDYALFPHMTVLKNVAYGQMVKGVNKKIYYQKANEMLDIVLRTFLMAASVTFASALIAFPIAYYMVLPIQASLERVPSSMIEVSSDLGARPGQTFRKVILPLAFPGVVAVFIIAVTFIPILVAYYVTRGTENIAGSGK